MAESMADRIEKYISGKIKVPAKGQSLKDILGPENIMPTTGEIPKAQGPYRGEKMDRGIFDRVGSMIKRLSPGMNLSRQPRPERERQFFPKSPGYKY